MIKRLKNKCRQIKSQWRTHLVVISVGVVIAFFADVAEAILEGGFSWGGFFEDLMENPMSKLLVGLLLDGAFVFLGRLLPTPPPYKLETELDEGEQIILEDWCSLSLDDNNTVGGKLFLTNKHLTFKPHKTYKQFKEKKILLEDIQAITRVKMDGKYNNSLKFTSKEGSEWTYILSEREQWLTALEEQKSIVLIDTKQTT